MKRSIIHAAQKTVMLIFMCLAGFSATAQLTIPRQWAKDDVDTLVSTLERVHFNPYLYINKDAFYKMVRKTKASFSDSVPVTDFLRSLHRLLAMIDDGHTMPSIFQQGLKPELYRRQFINERFVREGRRLFAGRNDSAKNGLPPGAEIISINNIQIRAFLDNCDHYFGGSPAHVEDFSQRIMSYLLYLEGVRPPFRVMYKANGKVVTQNLTDSVSFVVPLLRNIPAFTKNYAFSLPDDGNAYLDYVTMSGDLNQWGIFLDSVLQVARVHGCKKLWVDLRNNSGGNSFFNNYLLVYLTRKKFAQSSGRCLKISRDYKELLLKNGDTTNSLLLRPDNSTWCEDFCGPKENVLVTDSVYNFDTYFITGPFTFSSANMLVDAVKTFSLGTIVGEPSGEYTNDFGEVLHFTLPKSKLDIQTTMTFDYGADCNKAAKHVVYPDILIKPTFTQKINGIDAVMEYIMQ